MTWHALSMLEDSFGATKLLLLPFKVTQWVVLGLVAFFVSGTSGLNPTFNLNVGEIVIPRDTTTAPPFDDPMAVRSIVSNGDGMGAIAEGITAAVGPGVLAVVLFVAAVVLLIGLVLVYIGAVMEFVFVEIARTRSISIRGFFRGHTRTGFSLFLLRISVAFVLLAGSLVVLVLTIITEGLFLIVLLLAVPMLFIFGVTVWLVLRFTTDFIVPVMIAESAGLIEGWRLFWPELNAEWKQYGVYAIVRIILGVGAGVLAGIGFATVALALAIPFAIVGFGGFILLVMGLGAEGIGLLWAATVIVVFIIAVIVVGTIVIQVPIQTYLRYYGLFVLAAISPPFDLVDEVRMAIEADERANEVGNDDRD